MKNGEKLLIGVLIVITIIVAFKAYQKKNSGSANAAAPGAKVTETADGTTETAGEDATEEATADNGSDNYKKYNDGTKENTSEALKKEKEVDGIKFSDIQFVRSGDETELVANVENKSGKDLLGFTDVTVSFIDKDGNELGSLTGMIAPINNKEKTQFSLVTSSDYIGAYDFTIKLGTTAKAPTIITADEAAAAQE